MKVTAVSGDMVVKLGIAAVAGLVLLQLLAKAKASLPSADGVIAGLTPWNPNNYAYSAVNAGVSAATGRDETLGGLLHDVLTPDPVYALNHPTNPNDVTGNGTGDGSFLDLFNQANSY